MTLTKPQPLGRSTSSLFFLCIFPLPLPLALTVSLVVCLGNSVFLNETSLHADMASRDPRSASRPPQYGHAYPYNDPPVAISPAPPPHPPLPPPVPAAHYPGPPVLANHMLGHPYLQGPWMGANAVPPVFAAPGPGLTLQMGPYSHLMSPMPPPGAGLHFSQPPPASPGVSQYSDALRQPTAASALTTSSKEPQVNPGDARNRPVPTSLQLAGPRNPTVRDIDSVAQPSEMPIGSLVHRMSPPKWGVVKIANVSLLFPFGG